MPIYVHDCFRFVWLSPQDSAGNMPDYTAVQRIATAELPLATVAMRRIRLNLTKSAILNAGLFLRQLSSAAFSQKGNFCELKRHKIFTDI